MIKQLNLQNADEYIFYLYEKETEVRQIVGDFKNKMTSHISGDINSPSDISFKYLDIYDGMQNIPDTIINYEGV